MGNKQLNNIILLVGCVMGLILIVSSFYNASIVKEDNFSVENFYAGNKREESDPKKLYEDSKMGVDFSKVTCKTKMDKAKGSELAQAGNCIWLAPIDTGKVKSISSYTDIAACTDGSDSRLRPYNEGDHIISPGKLDFINSNRKRDENGNDYIAAYIGSKYVIRWDNIDCWWCHEGRTSEKHDNIVGGRGDYSSCLGGYIIGVATEDTIVTLYEVTDSGTQQETSFINLFGNF